MESGIEIALRKGFHTMIAFDMGRKCQAALDACPTCDFAALEPGKTYCYKSTTGACRELLTIGEVTQVTSKRTQAVVIPNHGGPRRIYKGDYDGYGTFIELSDDLRLLSDTAHENIVAAAVAAGLEVPPEVRREYPALFVVIPERFAQSNTTARQRVVNAFSPSWVKRDKALTPETLDEQIEETHRQIAKLQDTRCQAIIGNPDTAADWDQYLDDYRKDIDFYRWLRRLVDVGGVFHIPPNAA